jgi:starvation-inducible outer membrane lipoprotein
MKKYLLCVSCLLLSAGIAFTQTKPKTIVKKSIPELQKLLTGTGLPYKMANDSLAVIPYEGENIASYQVIVQKISDLYIVYTNLTEALPGKIDDTKYKYLLQQNDNYDVIKIGISADDGTVYLRADVYKAGTTAVMLTRIIKQVANVTNIVAGELK